MLRRCRSDFHSLRRHVSLFSLEHHHTNLGNNRIQGGGSPLRSHSENKGSILLTCTTRLKLNASICCYSQADIVELVLWYGEAGYFRIIPTVADFKMRKRFYLPLTTVLLVFTLCLVRTTFAAQPIVVASLNPSYASVQIALVDIDDRSLNATLSISINAQIDNATAPNQLQVQISSEQQSVFFSKLLILNATDRNTDYAYYRAYTIVNVPLGNLNSTLYPYDKYSFAIDLSIVPTGYFDSSSTLSVDQLIILPKATFGWTIVPGKTTHFIDSAGVVHINGFSASISRDAFEIDKVAYPIYGMFWLLGGSLALKTSKTEKDNLANRVAILVAAFIALTGFSILTAPDLAAPFRLPSVASLLVEGAEIVAVMFAFVAFVDANTSSRWAAIFDASAAVASIAVVCYIVQFRILGVVFNLTSLPVLDRILIIVGLVSGLSIRLVAHWFSGHAAVPAVSSK